MQDDMEKNPVTNLKREINLKISNRIIGRSFKPIRGLFHALPEGKVFLHSLNELARDTTLRNCGPGYILRRVIDQTPSKLLDQDFIFSEKAKCDA